MRTQYFVYTDIIKYFYVTYALATIITYAIIYCVLGIHYRREKIEPNFLSSIFK